MSIHNQFEAMSSSMAFVGPKNLYKTLAQTVITGVLATSFLFCANQAQANQLDNATSNSNITSEHKLPLEGTTLNIALSVNPPFINLSEDFKSPSGIEVDIIKELQRRTGFEISRNRMSVMTYASLMEKGEEQQFDIMAGSISYSNQYAQKFDVSPSYLSTTITLVANKKSSIHSTQDLANSTIAIPKRSNRLDFIGNLPNYNVKEVSSPFLAFFSVSEGTADATFMVTPVAEKLANNWSNKDLQIVGAIPNSQNNLCLLFKKGSPNNAYLEQAFLDMQADGTMDEILQRYIGAQHASL